MIKLKPCPFCGGEAKLFVSDGGVCVMCVNGFEKNCGCRTGWYDDSSYIDGMNGWRKSELTAVDRAIEAWNRRAERKEE